MASAAPVAGEGRPPGGPLSFHPRPRLGHLLLAAGCASTPPPDPGPSPLERPLEALREVGMLAGPAEFPAVIGTGVLAGPADSAFVLIGLSLPNSALRFERDVTAFRAEYVVSLLFTRDGEEVRRVRRQETVLVPGYAETARTDESIIFQEAVLLAPGRYELAVEAGRSSSMPILQVLDTVEVPSFSTAAAAIGGPLLLHEGAGRDSRDVPPAVILNPRHTVSYGGERPILYVERYGGGEAETLIVRVIDERDLDVRRFELRVAADSGAVRAAQLELSVEDLPLGRLEIEVVDAAGNASPRVPMIVSVSDRWLLANFDDVLHFLRYIAAPHELDALREGDARERRDSWEEFWARRDPVPATPVNEFRTEFFERIRYATEHFAEPGMSGWRTHRGEAYVVLGPPDHVQDRFLGRGEVARANGIEWIYEALPGGRLSLLFIDGTGLGRYAFSPASEAAFRSVADRLRRATER